jgi:hypothetical protein
MQAFNKKLYLVNEFISQGFTGPTIFLLLSCFNSDQKKEILSLITFTHDVISSSANKHYQ